MASEVVNLVAKLGRVSEHWSPRVVAMNDYQFKVLKLQSLLAQSQRHRRSLWCSTAKWKLAFGTPSQSDRENCGAEGRRTCHSCGEGVPRVNR
jgi:hypothetical protein